MVELIDSSKYSKVSPVSIVLPPFCLPPSSASATTNSFAEQMQHWNGNFAAVDTKLPFQDIDTELEFTQHYTRVRYLLPSYICC